MSSQQRRIGVLGGGQLGRMMAEAAQRLLIPLSILDPAKDAPAKKLLAGQPHIDQSFKQLEGVQSLAQVDTSMILTTEIEHVDCDALEKVSSETGVEVEPKPHTIRIIQDKWRQKEFLRFFGIPVADFALVSDATQLENVAEEFGFPFLLKTRRLAYDGRGNVVVRNPTDMANDFARLNSSAVEGGLYAERFMPFIKELAVIVVKSKKTTDQPSSAELKHYPVVQTLHKSGICHLVLAPAQISPEAEENAVRVALDAVRHLDGAGVYAVELFLLKDDEIYVNEIAPRPHNSGHFTIDACATSQFENHLRAVSGLPLGDTRMRVPAAVMLNLLGGPAFEKIRELALTIPGATMHLYDKEPRLDRKVGHINAVGNSVAQVLQSIQPLLDKVKEHSSAEDKEEEEKQLADYFQTKPLVGIIMGSDSDLPIMRGAADILTQLKVPFEVTIVSAHRTPQRLQQYAQTAELRGLQVIVAGAGGAAHLPGMTAAQTALPVIGVPVKGKTLDGVDSLYSIVQMPRGIPVATVAINGAENAGLLAARMLAMTDKALKARLYEYSTKMEQQVMEKVERMNREGWQSLLLN